MGLSVEGLTVRAGGKLLLDRVDCALEPGSICAVLGPNGAGKSTSLKAIAGLVHPASGDLMVDDIALPSLDRRERARLIGYLPQDYRLAWDIRVTDIVRLGRFAHHDDRNEDDRIVAEAMAATDTAQFAERTSATLSGGELARVMLARLIAGQHRYILADEPLASLDPAYQRDIAARLRALADAGTGILLVVHDVNLALRIADRVLMLKDGRVFADGTVSDTMTPNMLNGLYDTEFELRAGSPPLLAMAGA